MANFETPGPHVIGVDADETRYATASVHAGGDAAGTITLEPFILGNTVTAEANIPTVIARDCTILTQGFAPAFTNNAAEDATNGLTDFENVNIQIVDGNPGTVNAGGTFHSRTDHVGKTWTNVNMTYDSTDYLVIGPWSAAGNTGNAKDYIWNNVGLFGDIGQDETSLATYCRVGLTTFTLQIGDNSVFNNVNFYNGQDLANSTDAGALIQGAKGAAPQLVTQFEYSQPTFCPAGTIYNDDPQLVERRFRGLIRFTGASSGLYTPVWSGDARSWAQMSGDGLKFGVIADANARVFLWNFVYGIPTITDDASQTGFFRFGKVFDGTQTQIRTLVATNPDYTTNHAQFTFLDSDEVYANNGYNSTTLPTDAGKQIDNPSNGFGIVHQAFSTSSSSEPSADGTWGGSVDITQLTDKTYRLYAWNEQVSATTFGEMQTITVPVATQTQTGLNNIHTDADIATAEAGGFDRLTGGGVFQTSTTKSFEIDPYIVETGYANPTAALTAYNVTATERTVSDIPTMIKAITMGRTSPDDNSQLTLEYTQAGGNAQITADVTLDSSVSTVTGTTDGNGYSAFSIPTTDVLIDDVATGLTIDGELTLSGTVGSGTSNTKSSFTADVVNLDTMADRTYNNLNIIGNVAGIIPGHTIGGLTINGDRTAGLVGFSGAVSIEDIFGARFTRNGTITLNSDTAITVNTGDTSFVAGTNVTIQLPPVVVTINNPLSADTGFGDVYWALYNDTTRVSEGNFSGASESITIGESDIGTDTYTLSVVGRGYVEQVDQITYALGDQTFNITEDRSYDRVTTPSTDVTVTSANNTDDTDFRMNLPTGSSAFSTRSSQNATVGANKSNQFYARFVARTGVGIAFESNNDTTWYADGTFTAGIMIVPSDPISTDSPALQGARYNNGIDAPILYAQSLETQAAFTAAVVNTLEQTSITATTTTRAEGDSTIDLGAFDATTTSVLIRENIATETDVTGARDAIVGTNGTGNTLSALKDDTETILDRTQIIIEE